MNELKPNKLFIQAGLNDKIGEKIDTGRGGLILTDDNADPLIGLEFPPYRFILLVAVQGNKMDFHFTE